ncbi:MAG: hypothetical protein IKJ98_02010 [Bacteroidales bacterium]|nr:hypothetical protein [Bacteroidales bacterium]
MDNKLLLFLLLLSFAWTGFAQDNSVHQNASFQPYDRYLYNSENRFHTSVKPYDMTEVNKIVNIDTLYVKGCKNKYVNHFLNNDWVRFRSNVFNFNINPTFNFELSQHNGDNNEDLGWINDRGVFVNGNITDKVYFYSAFHEIQSNFTDYRRDRIKELGHNTIPGISRGKAFGENGGLDYAYAEGFVSYIPNDYFRFQLGHGKNFIGDGYRSLILSDNAQNYPYFKITTNVWHLKYVMMWSQQYYLDKGHLGNTRYPKKWNVMHYLDWSVTKWLNIAFFETINWGDDTLGTHRGFEFNYINPCIFLRPVEFSIGSPDNCLMGLTGKLTLWKNHVFYGQAILDEFKFSEFKKHSGWWGSKYGLQAGYKTFDIAGVKNLDFQTEFNYVRPFIYSHFTYSQNYAHAGQPLAHPRGSNFYESVSFLRYSWKRFFFDARYSYMVYGADTTGTNYGGDIFKLYQTRTQEYDNKIGVGADKNVITYKDFTVSYMLNPKSNMTISLGVTNRTQKCDVHDDKNQWMYFVGFRTNLNNFYYDF